GGRRATGAPGLFGRGRPAVAAGRGTVDRAGGAGRPLGDRAFTPRSGACGRSAADTGLARSLGPRPRVTGPATGRISASPVGTLPLQRVPTPFSIRPRDAVPLRGCIIPGWNHRSRPNFRYSSARRAAENALP